MRTIRFYDEVYQKTFYVFIGGTSKDFITAMKRRGVNFGKGDEFDGAYFKGFENKRADYCFIWINSYDKELLAHECLHATIYVLDKAGVPINKKTDEASCYYLQYLLQKIKDKYER